jgi:hypothetical protein
MTQILSNEVQIQSDGITVWIHHGGETIARFGNYGIDIHSTVNNQLAGQPVCLSCTHTKTTAQDWYEFVKQVKSFYGIVVSDSYMPDRFLE